MNPIRHHIILVIALALAAALCGCADADTDRRLDQADAVMEPMPDSALAIIESIDTSAISSRATRARHALLLTQARVKCNVPIASDSLISVAADYFADHGPDSLRMRSTFYKGWVLYQSGDFTAATNPSTQAHDIAVKLNDPYWRAKSAELLSFIHTLAYLNDKALAYSREAAHFYDIAGRKLNSLYSMADVSTAYCNLALYDLSIKTADSIVSQSSVADSYLVAHTLPNVILANFLKGDNIAALQAVKKLERLSDYCDLTLYDSITIANVKVRNGDNSFADTLLSQIPNLTVSDKDKGNFMFLERDMRLQRNDYKRIKHLDDSIFALQDAKLRIIFNQSILNNQMNLYREEKIREAYKNKRITITSISALILLVLTILFVIIIYRSRIRYKNFQLEKKIEDIALLSEQLKDYVSATDNLSASLSDKKKIIELNESQIDRLNDLLNNISHEKDEIRQTLGELFRDKWSVLNSLCDEIFSADGSEGSRKALITNLESEVAKLGSQNNLLKIESAVDRHFGGIITALREQCPFLKPSDITFLALIYAGLSPKAICLFMDHKLKYYYNRRTRLIKRILNSDAPDKERFINNFP